MIHSSTIHFITELHIPCIPPTGLVDLATVMAMILSIPLFMVPVTGALAVEVT